jgi:hypothetical protein
MALQMVREYFYFREQRGDTYEHCQNNIENFEENGNGFTP